MYVHISFKLFSGLYAFTQLHLYFFNATKDNSSSVSASIRDSSLNQALKWKLLSVRKSSQNQAAEHIPGQLAQLLSSAWNACQDMFLRNRHWEVFEGKHSGLLAEPGCNGHCAGCLNPLFHQPASIFDALYPAYACHFLVHFSSCCLPYDFTAKEPFLSQFLRCKGKGRQMLLGLQLHELPEWVTSYIYFFTQCESKRYRNPALPPHRPALHNSLKTKMSLTGIWALSYAKVPHDMLSLQAVV